MQPVMNVWPTDEKQHACQYAQTTILVGLEVYNTTLHTLYTYIYIYRCTGESWALASDPVNKKQLFYKYDWADVLALNLVCNC